MVQNKRNYQKELDKILAGLTEKSAQVECPAVSIRQSGDNAAHTGASVVRPRNLSQQAGRSIPALLLHSCCAPCSSYVLEYLSQYFRITVFYYNPNIYPEDEYFRRVEEQKRLIREMSLPHPVSFLEGSFEPRQFYDAVRGLEQIPEGGDRCRACFRLRLAQTAELASARGFDYFTTTLTISPLKNAAVLNEIGEALAQKYHAHWLPCDFKKKNGYKRSIELSAQYHLYRQDYCGCVFSLQERQASRTAAAQGEIRSQASETAFLYRSNQRVQSHCDHTQNHN